MELGKVPASCFDGEVIAAIHLYYEVYEVLVKVFWRQRRHPLVVESLRVSARLDLGQHMLGMASERVCLTAEH